MMTPARFRNILLRHTPAFSFTNAGINTLNAVQALQVRPHVNTLALQKALPARGGKSWSTVGFNTNAHPWEAAHMIADAAVASGSDEHTYAEPNLEFTMPDDLQARSLAAPKPCITNIGDRLCMWPPAEGVLPLDWHLDKSNLREARKDPVFNGIERDAGAWRVTVGHLDTGVRETRARSVGDTHQCLLKGCHS